jgi:hypothetical protein
MIKTPRTPNPLRRGKIIALKLNAEEWRGIQRGAKKWAGGNVSAFIRHAALFFKP